tara:strand:- start:475 stop:1425 length:951 start_codon:yes stop_codon:yes gene_type:complete
MPNYNGVWSLSTQYQYAADWPSPPAVALFAGGQNSNVIEFMFFASTGGSSDYGDLHVANTASAMVGSTTRAVHYGGEDVTRMDFFPIGQGGTVADFGDTSVERKYLAGFGNTTRGIFAGGEVTGPTYYDVMDYITIASTGDATDFGNLSTAKHSNASAASTTRGLIFGGATGSSVGSRINVVEYVTIGSTGNTTDFGDMSVKRGHAGGLSSNTRALVAGGRTESNTQTLTIDYFTTASTGNATDFGDLNNDGTHRNDGTSNGIKGVWGPGNFSAAGTSYTYDTVTIATTGNATDFGNPADNKHGKAATSGSHGGIG